MKSFSIWKGFDILTMMDNLSNKEKEFHRLNKELDDKTKDIMRDVDLVVQNSYRDFMGFQTSLATAFQDFHADYPFHSQKNGKSNDIDPSEISSPKRDYPRTNPVVKLLRQKVQMLQSEVQSLKDELTKKSSNCKDLELENRKTCEVRDKFHDQNNSLKGTVEKLEANVNSLQLNCQEQTKQNESLKKEIETLKKEIKMKSQQLIQRDLRLNRLLEENEKLKDSLKCKKMEERELRNDIKKLKDKEINMSRFLQKEKLEILQSFKKQIFLVENLKKQIAFLEVSKQIQLTQDEFTKILNWKIENST